MQGLPNRVHIRRIKDDDQKPVRQAIGRLTDEHQPISVDHVAEARRSSGSADQESIRANLGHFRVEVTSKGGESSGDGNASLQRENSLRCPAVQTGKPHAHTVTGASGQAMSLLRRLAVYSTSSSEYGKRSGEVVRSRDTLVHPSLAGWSFGGRWLLSRAEKASAEVSPDQLPDPSKLPKEEACSNSLEFTKTRLKNPSKISSKFKVKSGFDVRPRKRTKSLNVNTDSEATPPRTGNLHRFLDPPPRPFLLSNLSKSDELLPLPSSSAMVMSAPGSGADSKSEQSLSPSSSGLLLPDPNETSATGKVHNKHGNHGHRKNRVRFGFYHGQGHGKGHVQGHTEGHGHGHVYQNQHHHRHHGHGQSQGHSQGKGHAEGQNHSQTYGMGHAHHHHHHHHHQHGHRHGHHYTGKSMAHSMTRVTESRRFLTFTRYLPLGSARHFMEAHGSLLGESETYAVLFHHTSCYDIMPANAKLIILDGQLSITQAFKALIYNGIRAAPVWNSAQQTFTYMLTVTDFVDILNLCWQKLIYPDDRTGPSLDFDRLDRLTVNQWKTMVLRHGSNPNRTRQDSESSVSSSSTFRTRSCLVDYSLSEKGASNRAKFSAHLRSRSASLQLSSSPVQAVNTGSFPCSSSGSSPTPSTSSSSSSSSVSIKSTSNPSASESRCSVTSLPPTGKLGKEAAAMTKSVAAAGLLETDGFCLVTASPCDSLFRALDTLNRFRIHHLPILESPLLATGNCLHVVTQRALLAYLFGKIPHLPQPRFMLSGIAELGVGTFDRVAVVPLTAPLAEALQLFQQHRVSALPVVDTLESRRLIHLFSKYDVITMVLQGAHMKPNQTVKEWLEICKANQAPTPAESSRPPVEICLPSSGLYSVIHRLVKTGFRRLVVVNNTQDYRVDGIVSLSDVLKFTVLHQVRSSILSLDGGGCASVVGPPPALPSSSSLFRRRPPSVAEVADELEEAPDGEEKARLRGSETAWRRSKNVANQ